MREMRKEQLAVGGALGLSFLVASCCLAPSLFLVFGVSVSALGAFTALAPYHAYFVAAGLAALGFAAYGIFLRPQPAASCADEACAPQSPRRRATRRFFFVGTAIFAISALYPVVLESLL